MVLQGFTNVCMGLFVRESKVCEDVERSTPQPESDAAMSADEANLIVIQALAVRVIASQQRQLHPNRYTAVSLVQDL